MTHGPVSTATRRRVRISAARRPSVRESDAIGGGVAAFDGRFPGHTTGLGAMAVSEPPWHAHCSHASVNGEDHAGRTFKHTRAPFHVIIDPADPARLYWSMDREVSSASCYLVDAVMVGVQEGARGGDERLARTSSDCSVVRAMLSCRCEGNRLERLASVPGGTCPLVCVHGRVRVNTDGTDPAIAGGALAAAGPAAIYE